MRDGGGADSRRSPAPKRDAGATSDPKASNGWTLSRDAVRARLSGRVALIVDGDAEAFGRMFVSLAAAECRAVLARRAAQALQLAAQLRPTLVIFSTCMADVSAADLFKQLRGAPGLAGAVMVALSDRESKRERKRLIEMGCDGYLWKPVDRFLFAMDLLQRTPRLLNDSGRPPAEHQSIAARDQGGPEASS